MGWCFRGTLCWHRSWWIEETLKLNIFDKLKLGCRTGPEHGRNLIVLSPCKRCVYRLIDRVDGWSQILSILAAADCRRFFCQCDYRMRNGHRRNGLDSHYQCALSFICTHSLFRALIIRRLPDQCRRELNPCRAKFSAW